MTEFVIYADVDGRRHKVYFDNDNELRVSFSYEDKIVILDQSTITAIKESMDALENLSTIDLYDIGGVTCQAKQ